MNFPKQRRCRELAKSSSFSRSLYSQIEEVGWENLVHMAADMRFLSFRVIDKKGRAHTMEIQLEKGYPKCPPSVSADVPYIFDVEWSVDSRMKDLVIQFREHLDKLQDFWSTLDEIDNTLCTVNVRQPSHSMSCRQIDLGCDCFMLLSVDAKDPRFLPECRFVGSDSATKTLSQLWQRNSGQWRVDRTFLENFESILNIEMPRPANVQMNDQQIECGICYAQFLPNDDELGSKSGSETDHMCDNSNCRRSFHSICLVDWLLSITTTRQSFDVLFGNCPYCSEPVAVKINNAKR